MTHWTKTKGGDKGGGLPKNKRLFFISRDCFVPFASLWASAHDAPHNDKEEKKGKNMGLIVSCYLQRYKTIRKDF